MIKQNKSRFSDRFHELCDAAGFISGRGRAAQVSRFFDVGITSSRNWLVENICPRNPTLVKIVTRLRKDHRLDKSHDDKQIILWLEKGESYMDNPFQKPAETHKESSELIRVLRTYPAIDVLLNKAGIDAVIDEAYLLDLIQKALLKTKA